MLRLYPSLEVEFQSVFDKKAIVEVLNNCISTSSGPESNLKFHSGQVSNNKFKLYVNEKMGPGEGEGMRFVFVLEGELLGEDDRCLVRLSISPAAMLYWIMIALTTFLFAGIGYEIYKKFYHLSMYDYIFIFVSFIFILVPSIVIKFQLKAVKENFLKLLKAKEE